MKRYIFGAIGGLIVGAFLTLGIPAFAGTHGGHGYPTPTPTVTTPTPTPTPTPPVVNPFAGCAFSATLNTTFDPIRHRFVRALVPAIVCDRFGRTLIYDLVRG